MTRRMINIIAILVISFILFTFTVVLMVSDSEVVYQIGRVLAIAVVLGMIVAIAAALGYKPPFKPFQS